MSKKLFDFVAYETARKIVQGELPEAKGAVFGALRSEANKVLRYADSVVEALSHRGIVLDSESKAEVLEDGIKITIVWKVRAVEPYKGRIELGVRAILSKKDLNSVVEDVMKNSIAGGYPEELLKKYKEELELIAKVAQKQK